MIKRRFSKPKRIISKYEHVKSTYEIRQNHKDGLCLDIYHNGSWIGMTTINEIVNKIIIVKDEGKDPVKTGNI